MKVILLLNDLHLDGMGSVAVTLLRAMRAQGVECVALHAYDEIDLDGYREEFAPLFVVQSSKFRVQSPEFRVEWAS